ncbi:hypothetical protein [Thermanaeromonas sp. C210]|uniref:hypothetical protein n=1 Tax=Thermanaeromonas sp. C210 TaxID=2731925 RepID=UPI00155C6487|nr:hypothetical protein [Thermanaeromonas sp. C210]GFN22428.1 hypothetical protein TAMC210_07440 [Thermanaeromonas sp. C210]
MPGSRRRYLAFFLLGVLVGAVAANVRLAQQLDWLHLTSERLRQQLDATACELAEVKEKVAQQHLQVVTAVEPIITFPPNSKPPVLEGQAISLALAKEVQRLMAPLVGQEVSKINLVLVPGLVDDRVVKINGRSFKLKVTLVLISERVVVHVQAQPQANLSP